MKKSIIFISVMLILILSASVLVYALNDDGDALADENVPTDDEIIFEKELDLDRFWEKYIADKQGAPIGIEELFSTAMKIYDNCDTVTFNNSYYTSPMISLNFNESELPYKQVHERESRITLDCTNSKTEERDIYLIFISSLQQNSLSNNIYFLDSDYKAGYNRPMFTLIAYVPDPAEAGAETAEEAIKALRAGAVTADELTAYRIDFAHGPWIYKYGKQYNTFDEMKEDNLYYTLYTRG